MVTGADGNEYGPVDFATLVEWARDDRVRPGSRVRELATGREMTAADIPGLFVPAAMNRQSSPYYRPNAQSPMPDYQRPVVVNTGALTWAFIDSALAVLMVFAFGGLGIFFAIFAIVNAFRARAEGHQLAPIAIACAFLATVLVIIGWMIRGFQ